MALPDPLVLIDLETTGANPVGDRITEIAILRIEGGEIVARWESLVNPQRAIPSMIVRLIGISDAMVADAPTFVELAPQVRSLLDGAVFVAHNARFDYGFICNEFQRIGEAFEAPVLCTVKLSRALYPEHHRHGLDALIARHGFVCDARHRAMGDAEVLRQFTQQVASAFPVEVLERACAKAMKLPPRPPGLPEGALEGLPEGPGVYLLFGERDVVLRTGRCASLRAQVIELLSSSKQSGRVADLAARVRRVDWQQSAGELEAALQELELTRTHGLRQGGGGKGRGSVDAAFGLRLIPRRKRAPVLERVPLTGTDPGDWREVHGVFRSSRESDSVLHGLAEAYRLCPQRLGLEPGKGACTASQKQRCAGVCAGRESIAAHDERLERALGAVDLKAWPWPAEVVVHEHWAPSGRQAWHVLDRWCHLGSAHSEAALAALLEQAPPRRFDPDVYRILVRWQGGEGQHASLRRADDLA
ncbi:MAG: ethanolamine utilization protein [Rhodocyclales bacterium]|nr:ethanolamine utilization protein [Rhodocyclales bacterium]